MLFVRGNNASCDFWVVTSYFNPAKYQSRRRNHAQFVKSLLQQGVPCLTVECALLDQPFELPPHRDVLHIRAQSVLWHKERLINLAVENLPNTCRFVAWVDADVLFADGDWPSRTRELLKQHVAVQPFETVSCLPKEASFPNALPTQTQAGFAAKVTADKSVLQAGRFDAHGHTGFAWAAHRTLWEEVGLYEACVVGSADHLMAHAFLLEPDSPCVTRLVGKDAAHHRHFVKWSARLAAFAERHGLSGVGFAPGVIAHLWHGELSDRRYFERNQKLKALDFDPERDLISVPGEPLRLREPAGALADFLAGYFAARREDG